MQVILMEKVHNLGQLGDIVKVKDGFARNFLIPQGKAKRATDSAIAEFQGRRAELELQQGKALAESQARAARLEGLMIQITQNAGVDGRLFGSVTNYDIAETLKAQGHEVTKAMVRMPQGPLKQIGDYPITLDLHADVTATITVSVLGETVS
ncbi:MAG TPA: 50S ribosomal protein L9 [Burkholderiales bacterium]|jgi:large subunit ribosomal protein L9|nr:50S ribosomal protein L9 [Burkholderiales bacterium]